MNWGKTAHGLVMEEEQSKQEPVSLVTEKEEEKELQEV